MDIMENGDCKLHFKIEVCFSKTHSREGGKKGAPALSRYKYVSYLDAFCGLIGNIPGVDTFLSQLHMGTVTGGGQSWSGQISKLIQSGLKTILTYSKCHKDLKKKL